jgi:hypothetical protein
LIPLETQVKILETFYKGFDDYAVDRRGDVGSWVREEAMVCLRKYIHIILESKDAELIRGLGADEAKFYEKFICSYL